MTHFQFLKLTLIKPTFWHSSSPLRKVLQVAEATNGSFTLPGT